MSLIQETNILKSLHNYIDTSAISQVQHKISCLLE